MADIEKSESDERKPAASPPALEWAFAVIGLILVAGAIGFLIYKAAGEKDAPPNISISVNSIKPTSDGFLVIFRVSNHGALTAAALTVEGELKKNGESIETSSATVAYAPSNSERRGGLIFTKNPNDFDLTIRAAGYEEP